MSPVEPDPGTAGSARNLDATHPSRSPRLSLIVVGGVALFLLSRLPFLVAHPQWGPLEMENCWMVSVPRIVEDLRGAYPGSDISLQGLAPHIFHSHYHGGAWWAANCVSTLYRLTGTRGMLGYKLVSVLHAAVAFGIFLVAMRLAWPRRLIRTWLPSAVLWIVPPTLLLWSSVLLMGHYFESWLFYGMLVLPLVVVIKDRMPIWGLGLAGLVCGLATVYCLSNAVYAVVLAITWLLLTSRSLRTRILGGVVIAAAALSPVAVYYLGNPSRLSFISERLVQGAHQAHGSRIDPLSPIAHAIELVTPDTVIRGDGWSRAGLFALFEGNVPAPIVWGGAYVVAVLCGIGAVRMLIGTGALLGRRRRRLTVGQKLIGAHGMLLVATLSVYMLFVPAGRSAFVSYLVPCYPTLMFGLGHLLVDAVSLRRAGIRRYGRVVAGVALALLAAGWGSSAATNLRPLDRPYLESCDDEHAYIVRHIRDGDRELSRLEVEEHCTRIFPGDEAFCRATAWQVTVETRDAAYCTDIPPAQAAECAAAWGRVNHSERLCDPYVPEFLYTALPAEVCAEFGGALHGSCLSGAHQGRLLASPEQARCLNAWTILCRQRGEEWQRRACLERSAWLLMGMPPFPGPPTPTPPHCSLWPTALTGLCGQASEAQQATGDEPSCEHLYLERFAKELPERNRLLYEQCLRIEGNTDMEGLYPYCAVGVARFSEGLDCSWDGGALLGTTDSPVPTWQP